MVKKPQQPKILDRLKRTRSTSETPAERSAALLKIAAAFDAATAQQASAIDEELRALGLTKGLTRAARGAAVKLGGLEMALDVEDLTPTEAMGLVDFCVDLNDLERALADPQAKTLADGKPKGEAAKGKRGRRKGVPASDVKKDQRIAEAWAKGYGEYAFQEELATAFGITKPDVVTALDRHRKRQAKPESIRAGKRRQAQ